MAIPVNQLDLGALAALASSRPVPLNLPLHGVEIGDLFSGRAEGVYKALALLDKQRSDNLQAQVQREGYGNQMDITKLQEGGANQRLDKSLFSNEKMQQNRIDTEVKQAALDRMLKQKEIENQAQYQAGQYQLGQQQNQIGMENANTARMEAISADKLRQTQAFNEKFKLDLEKTKQLNEDQINTLGAASAFVTTRINQGGDPKDINTSINNFIDSLPVDSLSAKDKTMFKNKSLTEKQAFAAYGTVLAYGAKLASSPSGVLAPWVQNTGAVPVTKEQSSKIQEDIRQNNSVMDVTNDALKYLNENKDYINDPGRRADKVNDILTNEPKAKALEPVLNIIGYGQKDREQPNRVIDNMNSLLGQVRLKFAETVGQRLAGNPSAQKQFEALLPQDSDDYDTLQTKLKQIQQLSEKLDTQNKEYLSGGISTGTKSSSSTSSESTFSHNGRTYDLSKWKAQNPNVSDAELKNFIKSNYK